MREAVLYEKHEVKADFKAIENAPNKYMEERDENNECYFYFHEFAVVND